MSGQRRRRWVSSRRNRWVSKRSRGAPKKPTASPQNDARARDPQTLCSPNCSPTGHTAGASTLDKRLTWEEVSGAGVMTPCTIGKGFHQNAPMIGRTAVSP